LSAGGDASSHDIQGWYRLDVLSPPPAGQIVAHYRVMCGADDEVEPAVIRAIPAQPPMELALMAHIKQPHASV
jgi:hypothetical protein